jgi:hypothetical protein
MSHIAPESSIRGFLGMWGWPPQPRERSGKRTDCFYGLTRSTGGEAVRHSVSLGMPLGAALEGHSGPHISLHSQKQNSF